MSIQQMSKQASTMSVPQNKESGGGLINNQATESFKLEPTRTLLNSASKMSLEQLCKDSQEPDLAASLIGAQKPLNLGSCSKQASEQHPLHKMQTVVAAPLTQFVIPNNMHNTLSNGLPPARNKNKPQSSSTKRPAPRASTSASKAHNSLRPAAGVVTSQESGQGRVTEFLMNSRDGTPTGK